MTNYERIHAMDKEKLAFQLASEQVVAVLGAMNGLSAGMAEDFKKAVNEEWDTILQEKLAWLDEDSAT